MVITRSVMILTVTLNAWFILLGVKFVMLGMSAKLTKSLGYGGTTTVKIKGGQHQGLTTNSLFFHAHWLDENHNGLEADAEVTIIDRTEPSDPTKRERFWINKLGTSLNVD